MEGYLIKKVLNNNVILVQKNNQSYILVGKGIGFDRKKGTLLKNLDNIEEKFISLKALNEYESLLTAVDPQIIEITQKIIEMIKAEMEERIESHVYFALIDHINFAIKRLKEGIEIVNPFLFEIELLYPVEYELAESAVSILEKELKINIPKAEIGFLTLHIYGVKKDKSKNEALENSKMISEILKVVEGKLEIKLEKDSFLCRRFVMHLIGVINRAYKGKFYENKFLHKLEEDLKSEFNVAYYIVKIIENKLKIRMPKSEMGYIAIHLHKINS